MFVLECWELLDSKTASLQDTSKSIQPCPGPINSESKCHFSLRYPLFRKPYIHSFTSLESSCPFPPQPPAGLMQRYHIVATVPASSALQCKVIPGDNRCTTSSDNILLRFGDCSYLTHNGQTALRVASLFLKLLAMYHSMFATDTISWLFITLNSLSFLSQVYLSVTTKQATRGKRASTINRKGTLLPGQ